MRVLFWIQILSLSAVLAAPALADELDPGPPEPESAEKDIAEIMDISCRDAEGRP